MISRGDSRWENRRSTHNMSIYSWLRSYDKDIYLLFHVVKLTNWPPGVSSSWFFNIKTIFHKSVVANLFRQTIKHTSRDVFTFPTCTVQHCRFCKGNPRSSLTILDRDTLHLVVSCNFFEAINAWLMSIENMRSCIPCYSVQLDVYMGRPHSINVRNLPRH